MSLDVQSRVVLLPELWSCCLFVYLLSLWLYLVGVQLPQVVCALDLFWLSLRLCALDVRRTRRVISVCAIAVWYGCASLSWPSQGLCAFDVRRTRDAISVYTLLCGTDVLPCAWA